MENNTVWTPQVGEGVTVSLWTDCYSATVIKVSASGSQITLQDDSHKVVSGSAHDGSAVWANEPNPQGATRKATRRPNGAYRLAGWKQGGRVSPGRRTYQDPSF